jgi:DNA-binding response OmpR family regulator
MTLVLLVDDDAETLAMHGLGLKKAGIDSLCASDGSQALRLLEQQAADIDVVIADVNMPEMDGYALCEHIRAQPALRHMPVIFVSALSSLEERLKGYTVGGDDYLIKPVALDELSEKILQAARRRRESRDLARLVDGSQSAALHAASFSVDMARLVEFLGKVATLSEPAPLADELLLFAGHFKLRVAVRLQRNGEQVDRSDTAAVTPLEASILDLGKERIGVHDFGSRALISRPHVALLLKNLPKAGLRRNDLQSLLGLALDAVDGRLGAVVHAPTPPLDVLQDMERLTRGVESIHRGLHAELAKQLDETLSRLQIPRPAEDALRSLLRRHKEKIQDGLADLAALGKQIARLRSQLRNR